MSDTNKEVPTDEKPIEIDDKDLEKAAGGISRFKQPIYDDPGSRLE